MRNNISSGNRIAAVNIDRTCSFIEDHNILFGPIIGFNPSPTTKSVEPMFLDTVLGNFRLRAGSPAIDAGTNVGPNVRDLDGTLRPSGSGWDIGAYEFIDQPPTPPRNFRLLN